MRERILKVSFLRLPLWIGFSHYIFVRSIIIFFICECCSFVLVRNSDLLFAVKLCLRQKKNPNHWSLQKKIQQTLILTHNDRGDEKQTVVSLSMMTFMALLRILITKVICFVILATVLRHVCRRTSYSSLIDTYPPFWDSKASVSVSTFRLKELE